MHRDETPEGAEERVESPEPESPESDAEVEQTPVAEPELVEPEPELTPEEQLQAKLVEAEARLREVSKRFTEQQQEMKDFRTRMESQAQFKAERRSFEIARAVFEPVQNLKRSIASGADDVDGLLQGLQMVLQQFDQALVKLGMEPVPGVGAPFNPKWHEALAQTPVAEASQDGLVLMVHLAAQVIVGKYEAPAAET